MYFSIIDAVYYSQMTLQHSVKLFGKVNFREGINRKLLFETFIPPLKSHDNHRFFTKDMEGFRSHDPSQKKKLLKIRKQVSLNL